MIPVTKPFLSPFSVYSHFLEGIWKRQWLTNMGPLASDLEMRLKDLLENTELGVKCKKFWIPWIPAVIKKNL